MILNDDILDAIRNKKYSLKKVEPPMLGPVKIVTYSRENNMLVKILDRRPAHAYSDIDSDDELKSLNNLYSFWSDDNKKYFFQTLIR